jgi:hypothetical protein
MSGYDTEPETHHEAPDAEGGRRSGFHPVNVGHLVMGLAFVGLTVVWVLFQRDVVEIPDDGWVLGVPWLVAGAVGLVASAISGTRRAP